MKQIILLSCTLIITVSLINCSSNINKKSNELKKEEEFNKFYKRFYSDSIFQKARIILPLEGEIRSEGKIDNWEKGDIIVSSKETFLKDFPNMKSDIIKSDTVIKEKFWIDNSGFNVERIFILKEGKWYLKRYDITYI
jgi:hypothetical protein